MAFLNGQLVKPERLQANAEAMLDALKEIAEADDAGKARDIARRMLAPCHWFDFEVPSYGIANTEPEDMTNEAYAAFAATIPADRRAVFDMRRFIRTHENTYVNAIRNPEKRAYAMAYAHYIQGKTDKAPKAPQLSLMAAQAVRMTLDEIHAKLDHEAQIVATAKRTVPEQPLLMPLDPFTQPELL